jgi:predicted ribosome quality control (RQC) complex YloA/Tae2 family protein
LSLPNEKPSDFLSARGVSQESQEKDQNLVVALFNSISGLDPLLAETIVTESNGNPDSIWAMVHKISEKLTNGRFEWHLYQLSESAGLKSAVYPLSLPVGTEIARTESYTEAMRLHTELSILPLFIQELRQKASKVKRRELKRLKRLSGNLSKDLDKASRHEEFSLYGNLLSTHYDRIKRGMKEITLPDFSGTKEITIQLDSALEPRQNVQHYFKKAKKGKKGLKKIADRLKPVEERSAQLSDSLEELLRLTNPDKLLKLIPSQKASSFPRKGRSPEGFKQFVLDKHYTVYVGRSARENDLLTHKFASRQDLWFHAKGVPGSHVILKGANKSTPPDILKRAASIAAYYSKSRHSKIAPVTCTEKKYVSKPRKSPPGTASIKRETVFFVNPSIPSSD